MKILKRLTQGFLTTVIFFTSVVLSSQPDLPTPYKLYLEPSPLPNSAGPANLKLTIISTMACEEVTVTILGIDNLEYLGKSNWTFIPNVGDTNRFDISLVIPENDTSGIGITTKCANWPEYRIGAFFIADAEKVRFYHSNPRGIRRTPKGAVQHE